MHNLSNLAFSLVLPALLFNLKKMIAHLRDWNMLKIKAKRNDFPKIYALILLVLPALLFNLKVTVYDKNGKFTILFIFSIKINVSLESFNLKKRVNIGMTVFHRK